MRNNGVYDKTFFIFLYTMFLTMLFIGLIVSVPVGPISLLCVRKTIEHGLWAGLSIGFGAALADVLYAIGAVAGSSVMRHFIEGHRHVFKSGSGLLLLYLGIMELRKGQPVNKTNTSYHTHWLVVKSFFLTLTNPLTVLTFIGIFSVFGFSVSSPEDFLVVMLGIFSGSMLWWFVLGKTALKISSTSMRVLHVFSCVLLIGFGLWILIYA